ncbi:MAG: alpha/beta fold hydrolase [Myxococcales bacterium]
MKTTESSASTSSPKVPGTALAPLRNIPDDLALFPPGTTVHEDKLRCGITMRWYERGPKDAPTAILLHGYPEIGASWKHQVRALSDRYRVVAPDMRGCGASEGPFWFWHYTLGRLATDTIDLMEVLGVKKVHLVGHDWGAAVAWESAARFPESFTSLSIINCPPLPFLYRNTHLQAVRSSYSLRFMVPFWWNEHCKRNAYKILEGTFHVDEEHKRMFTPEVIQHYAAHGTRAGVPHMNYYRAGILLPPLRLRRVEVPTRLIWGLSDPWMNPFFGQPENYLHFVSAIEAVHLDGISHFAQQQSPDAVSEAMREHWQQTEAGKPVQHGKVVRVVKR